MGGESTSKAPPKKIHVETQRRPTTTSWRVQNCNDPLSTLEIGSIHNSVKTATQELKTLECDLAAAKQKVRALSKAHKRLRVFIAAERALLSPIRALPAELLSQIFLHHTSAFITHRGYIIASLKVSQICTTWRRVAHATALLWVKFPLYYCGNYGRTIPRQQIALYSRWCARSGTIPCDIAFRRASPAMEKRDDEDYSDVDPIFLNYDDRNSRLCLRKHRWGKLDLEYRSSSPFHLDIIDSTRSLTVHILEGEPITRRHQLVSSGYHDKLEELVLRCSSGVERPILLPLLPLGNVKRCEMDRFPLRNGLQILHEAKSLERLTWTTGSYETENIVDHVTSNIQTLDLNIWDLVDGLSPLFNYLTAPELHTLQIKWMYSEYSDEDATPHWISADFITFITRSEASLTSITLLHASICEEELIALLEHTPLLVHFSLSDRHARQDTHMVQMLGSRILYRLLPSAPGTFTPPLVPKLEVLLLRGGFDGNDICDADILRVFEARYPAISEVQMECARLTEGAFHLLRPADQQLGGKLSLAERASNLVARGLDFDFTTMEPDPEDPADGWETHSEGSASEA
ncbi:hypothetical protein DFH08DRAFT_932723 [Mycena albidolilacea]|uniref:F-box domain-containing protein n=1 Tax=Mycena albidolilacea TaxID=1033008 RepID=A0AAD7AF41_9AGAR|nr:hypothetical protein DFH08DRAFT_932723 [Mycena albidolilacea]